MTDFTEVESLEAEVCKLNQEIEEYKDRIETLEGLLRRIVQYGGRTPVLKVVGFQISVKLLEEARKVVGDSEPATCKYTEHGPSLWKGSCGYCHFSEVPPEVCPVCQRKVEQ